MAFDNIDRIVELFLSGMYPDVGIDLRLYEGTSSSILESYFDEGIQLLFVDAVKCIKDKRYSLLGPKGRLRKDLIEKISEGNKQVVAEFNKNSDAIAAKYPFGKELKEYAITNTEDYKKAIIDLVKKNGFFDFNSAIFKDYENDEVKTKRHRNMLLNMQFLGFKSNLYDKKNDLVALVRRLKSPERIADKICRKLDILAVKYYKLLKYQQRGYIRDEKFRVKYDDVMITDNEGILIAMTHCDESPISQFIGDFEVIESKSDIEAGRLNKQAKFFYPKGGRFLDFHNYNIGFIDKKRYVRGGWLYNEFFIEKFSLDMINDIIKHNINRNFKGVPHETYSEWILQGIVNDGKKYNLDIRNIHNQLSAIFGSLFSECYFPSINRGSSGRYSIPFMRPVCRQGIVDIAAKLDAKKMMDYFYTSSDFVRKLYPFSGSRKFDVSVRRELDEVIHDCFVAMEGSVKDPVESILDDGSVGSYAGTVRFMDVLDKSVSENIRNSVAAVGISDSYFGFGQYNFGKDMIFHDINLIRSLVGTYLPYLAELNRVKSSGSIEDYVSWFDRLGSFLDNGSSDALDPKITIDLRRLFANGCISLVTDRCICLNEGGKEIFWDKYRYSVRKIEDICESLKPRLSNFYLSEINNMSSLFDEHGSLHG